MEHTETKEIHNYGINLNKWQDKKPIQWAKFRVWTLSPKIYEPNFYTLNHKA
jgi:hypothetical protein